MYSHCDTTLLQRVKPEKLLVMPVKATLFLLLASTMQRLSAAGRKARRLLPNLVDDTGSRTWIGSTGKVSGVSRDVRSRPSQATEFGGCSRTEGLRVRT